ncbi:MAG: hypothetical protein RR533_09475 [Carnobacterium sp.]
MEKSNKKVFLLIVLIGLIASSIGCMLAAILAHNLNNPDLSQKMLFASAFLFIAGNIHLFINFKASK